MSHSKRSFKTLFSTQNETNDQIVASVQSGLSIFMKKSHQVFTENGKYSMLKPQYTRDEVYLFKDLCGNVLTEYSQFIVDAITHLKEDKISKDATDDKDYQILIHVKENELKAREISALKEIILRRDNLLKMQREMFFKELMMLKEQLLQRMRYEEMYKVENVELFDGKAWLKEFLGDEASTEEPYEELKEKCMDRIQKIDASFNKEKKKLLNKLQQIERDREIQVAKINNLLKRKEEELKVQEAELKELKIVKGLDTSSGQFGDCGEKKESKDDREEKEERKKESEKEILHLAKLIKEEKEKAEKEAMKASEEKMDAERKILELTDENVELKSKLSYFMKRYQSETDQEQTQGDAEEALKNREDGNIALLRNNLKAQNEEILQLKSKIALLSAVKESESKAKENEKEASNGTDNDLQKKDAKADDFSHLKKEIKDLKAENDEFRRIISEMKGANLLENGKASKAAANTSSCDLSATEEKGKTECANDNQKSDGRRIASEAKKEVHRTEGNAESESEDMEIVREKEYVKASSKEEEQFVEDFGRLATYVQRDEDLKSKKALNNWIYFIRRLKQKEMLNLTSASETTSEEEADNYEGGKGQTNGKLIEDASQNKNQETSNKKTKGQDASLDGESNELIAESQAPSSSSTASSSFSSSIASSSYQQHKNSLIIHRQRKGSIQFSNLNVYLRMEMRTKEAMKELMKLKSQIEAERRENFELAMKTSHALVKFSKIAIGQNGIVISRKEPEKERNKEEKSELTENTEYKSKELASKAEDEKSTRKISTDMGKKRDIIHWYPETAHIVGEEREQGRKEKTQIEEGDEKAINVKIKEEVKDKSEQSGSDEVPHTKEMLTIKQLLSFPNSNPFASSSSTPSSTYGASLSPPLFAHKVLQQNPPQLSLNTLSLHTANDTDTQTIVPSSTVSTSPKHPHQLSLSPLNSHRAPPSDTSSKSPRSTKANSQNVRSSNAIHSVPSLDFSSQPPLLFSHEPVIISSRRGGQSSAFATNTSVSVNSITPSSSLSSSTSLSSSSSGTSSTSPLLTITSRSRPLQQLSPLPVTRTSQSSQLTTIEQELIKQQMTPRFSANLRDASSNPNSDNRIYSTGRADPPFLKRNSQSVKSDRKVQQNDDLPQSVRGAPLHLNSRYSS